MRDRNPVHNLHLELCHFSSQRGEHLPDKRFFLDVTQYFYLPNDQIYLPIAAGRCSFWALDGNEGWDEIPLCYFFLLCPCLWLQRRLRCKKINKRAHLVWKLGQSVLWREQGISLLAFRAGPGESQVLSNR